MAARVEILAVGSLHRDLEAAARHFIDLLRPHATISVREVKAVSYTHLTLPTIYSV